ncbi:hypothetical protein OQA88_13335 [Cercophora sp. LCS_1]
MRGLWGRLTPVREERGLLETRQSNPSGHFDFPGAGPRQAWRIGEIQDITFETIFETYNIALWQQNPEGGSANLGPIVFQTSRAQANKTTSFAWTVQTYNLDPDVSNLYFFWIYNGSDASTQGRSLPSVSSAYFNILEKLPETATTSSRSSTSAPASSTPGVSTTNRPTGTGTNLPADTTAPGTTPPASTESSSNNVVPVAVGTALGVAGLAVLIGLVIWFLRKRKRQQTNAVHEVDGRPAAHQMDDQMVAAEAPVQNPRYKPPAWGYAPQNFSDGANEPQQGRKAELGVEHRPAELG